MVNEIHSHEQQHQKPAVMQRHLPLSLYMQLPVACRLPVRSSACGFSAWQATPAPPRAT